MRILGNRLVESLVFGDLLGCYTFVVVAVVIVCC
jgi:hypothetical protein